MTSGVTVTQFTERHQEISRAAAPVSHSAGPAYNLERIFYAILRLKAGRSQIVATKSVGKLFGHQTAGAKATSEPIVACTHLSTVTSQTASSKTRSATARLEQGV
jgi:hypothetical protein